MERTMATSLGNMQSAIVNEDGLLIIMSRKSLSEFTEEDWHTDIVISANGVKILKSLLDRAAELPLERKPPIPAALQCESCGREQPFHDPDCIFYADAPLP